MAPARGRLSINLLGPFRLMGADGSDYTPRGRKACGILALLATSPARRRSRKWLQDKLWSDRGEEQAAASLRQSLVEIRRALGFDRALLQANKTNVWLDTASVDVDLDGGRATPETLLPASVEVEFLEGMDIRDPEFEAWLREMRSSLSATAERTIDPARPEKSAAPVGKSHESLVLIAAGTLAPSDRMPRTADLVDAVAKVVAESGGVTVFDRRDGAGGPQVPRTEDAGQTIALQSFPRADDASKFGRVVLKNAATGEMIWSSSGGNGQTMPSSACSPGHDAEALLRQANLIAGIIGDAYLKLHHSRRDAVAASALCKEGAAYFFRLGETNFEIADRLFDRAYQIEPKGIYQGWRAYLRTFMLAERQFQDRDILMEEALSFIRLALEDEPYNSYVLSFAAQIHYLISRSYVATYEYAERSIELNPANPIGWSLLGTAKCYLGDLAGGLQDSDFAVRIAGAAPYRYHLLGQSCIANTLAHNIGHAKRLGQLSHMVAPRYAPPLRYLAALHFHDGEEAASWDMVRKLRISEPDFSFAMLKDEAYPSAGLGRSGLLECLPD